MATLEAEPFGSNINLGYIQSQRVNKNPGITLLPELTGDAKNTQPIKLLSSTLVINIQGVYIGNKSDVNSFKQYLDNWSIYGNGTDTIDNIVPTPIKFVDDDGIETYVVVTEVDYTRTAGQVEVLEYTIKMGQVTAEERGIE